MPVALPIRDAPWRDPAAVFAGIAAEHDDVFWLDAGPAARTGWSFAGWGEPDDPDAVRAATAAEGAGGARAAGGAGRQPALLTGSWVGWCGYEAGAARAGAPVRTDVVEAPGQRWLRVRGIAGWDHERRRMLVAGALDPRIGTSPPVPEPIPLEPIAPRIAHARHTPEEYAALIGRCREAIRAGDAYQLCLTTRFEVQGAVDALAAHRALRRTSPAPHGGIIRSGSAALVSASPEQFLRVAGDRVRTRPIKGTRPRGADEASDRALADQLRSDVKERAENTMIVDLMRNDLARVCVPGSVEAETLLAVESYPAVHQLVSAVSGRLPERCTVGELLDAAFPAGSMTGAPKLSAMTILHELEEAPRGVYAGCFGWVGAHGGMDLAMVIRSIFVHAGGAYVGAGGGITWRSDAAAEIAEVGIKARAPLAAVGTTPPPGW